MVDLFPMILLGVRGVDIVKGQLVTLASDSFRGLAWFDLNVTITVD